MTSHIGVETGARAVIHTGLSVIVRRHLVALARDETHRTATVYVRALRDDEYPALAGDERMSADPAVDRADVAEAADALARRARRTFGLLWTVVPWTPSAQVEVLAGA